MTVQKRDGNKDVMLNEHDVFKVLTDGAAAADSLNDS